MSASSTVSGLNMPPLLIWVMRPKLMGEKDKASRVRFKGRRPDEREKQTVVKAPFSAFHDHTHFPHLPFTAPLTKQSFGFQVFITFFPFF